VIAIVFVLFFIIPMILGRFIGYQTWGGYFSPLLLIVLTWLLYRRKGRNLSELGLAAISPTRFLPLGLILGIVCAAGLLLLQMAYNGWSVSVNPVASWPLVFAGVLPLLQGVLNEELIFRGYCFKETRDRIGAFRANLIFGFLFIVWHWIALNAWGHPGLMVSLVSTGFGHLLFATAFLESRTLYFPIGIHLGYNWADSCLFNIQSGPVQGAPTIRSAYFFVNTATQGHTAAHNFGSLLLNCGWFLLFAWLIVKWSKSRGINKKVSSNKK
jgi:membrane protease YdiL (CAAX protease family)